MKLKTNILFHKSCFNTSRLIVDQVPKGEDYSAIKKIFHISLLYFKLGEAPLYHGKTIIKEVETKKKLSLHIEDKDGNYYDAADIFPEYIFISIPQFDDKIERDIDKWLYIMKNEEVKPEFKSPTMKKVADKLSVLKIDKNLRNEYIKYNKDLATYKDTLEVALADGKRMGREEGEQRLEEAKFEIARKLIERGFSLEEAAKTTELDINILSSKLNKKD